MTSFDSPDLWRASALVRRRNPERLAWAILLMAFASFCLIVVGVPLGIRWYLLNAEVRRTALVEPLVGTVVVEPSLGRGPAPLSKGQSMAVSEGTLVRLDETSEAVVTFFDHSFMRLFPGTVVHLDRLRAPRFGISPLANSLHFSLLGGYVRIGTALSLEAPLDFRVSMPQGEALLDADGSYALQANNERAEVATYRGRAKVRANGVEMELTPRQRTQIELGRAPRPPMSVARNLLTNGDFREPLETGWRTFNDQGADGGDVDGHVEMVIDEGRKAVRLWRSGGYGNHCETVLEQVIDQRLPDPASSLIVRATVKVRYQSLSGGGYLSSEYPLMIRLTYRDVYDSETDWIQGFYYQNEAGNPTTYGQQLPQDRWYLFESGNLLETLPIKPFRIMRIRVYASGWDYESLISDISLIAE